MGSRKNPSGRGCSNTACIDTIHSDRNAVESAAYRDGGKNVISVDVSHIRKTACGVFWKGHRKGNCKDSRRKNVMTQGQKGEVMDEKKKIHKLYALLEEKERKKDAEAAAALRWAIFELENRR